MSSTFAESGLGAFPQDKTCGLFIVVDGLDGSGKTTQIAMMSQYLAFAGVHAITTKQPGGTLLGDKIRAILFTEIGTKNIPNDAMEMLLQANEINNVETLIKPALAVGKWVITDRYAPSGIAYMHARGGETSEYIMRLRRDMPVLDWDRLFLFDGEPLALLTRANMRNDPKQAAKKWNTPAQARKIRHEFLKRYADHPRTTMVRADSGTPEEIFERDVRPVLDLLIKGAKYV